MDSAERKQYFFEQEDALLHGGASISEWCTFISKSVYEAFVNGADLATVITAVVCIETYFKTEHPEYKYKTLSYLIDHDPFLTEEEKRQLHILRRYRNRWVHADRLDDTEILINEVGISVEVEEMAMLSVRMLLTVIFSNQFI